MKLRSPWVTRTRYEREIKLVSDSAAAAITAEYGRAMKAGRAQVHAWARDAAARFFYLDNHRAKGAAIAAFQQAEHQFNPAPQTLSEGLTKPVTVEEAIDAITGSERTAVVGISAGGRDASGRGHIRPV
jgi:hypothetical protein